MADDPQDIKLELEKECLAKTCHHKVEAYNACLERIKEIPKENEPHCYHQYFDIVHCVDVCVDPKLWPTLKLYFRTCLMPHAYFVVEKEGSFQRKLWTPRLLAIDLRRGHVYFSDKFQSLSDAKNAQSCPKWKRKFKLDQICAAADHLVVDVTSPDFDPRQLLTIRLEGNLRRLDERNASRGSNREIGLFGDRKARPLVIAHANKRDETLSPLGEINWKHRISCNVRCDHHVEFVRLYAMSRNVLVMAGHLPPVHCGLPPYDPRNGLAFPLVPLHLRCALNILEHAVFYLLLYGQLVFMGKKKSTPLALKGYLCITPDMVVVMRPDATVPRWVALDRISAVHYQAGPRPSRRGPFVAILSSGTTADILFEPLPPLFPPEQRDAFDACEAVREVTDVFIKLKPFFSKKVTLPSALAVKQKSNYHNYRTSTSSSTDDSTGVATSFGGCNENSVTKFPLPTKKILTTIATPLNNQTEEVDSTKESLLGAPYTFTEHVDCPHVLAFIESSVELCGRPLKWVFDNDAAGPLRSFLHKQSLAEALRLEDIAPSGLRKVREAQTPTISYSHRSSKVHFNSCVGPLETVTVPPSTRARANSVFEPSSLEMDFSLTAGITSFSLPIALVGQQLSTVTRATSSTPVSRQVFLEAYSAASEPNGSFLFPMSLGADSAIILSETQLLDEEEESFPIETSLDCLMRMDRLSVEMTQSGTSESFEKGDGNRKEDEVESFLGSSIASEDLLSDGML